MRGLAWLLAIVGIVQYGLIAYLQPEGYVSVDMAYLVMALFILAAAGIWALGCCWYGGCDCDHCEGCAGDHCCGNCACYGGRRGEPAHEGHEGHSHEGHVH